VEENWLTILDYASSHNLSISSVRRYIKAGKVDWREENGRYLIRSDRQISHADEAGLLKLKLEIEALKMRLRELQAENDDLRTLQKIYEERDQNPDAFLV
jgi:hypothetical protein